MRHYLVSFAGLVLLFTLPGTVDPESAVRDDPLSEAARALDQGRPWYASRLLRDLEGPQQGTPAAVLLAARADAGRGAWAAVVKRLESAAWLDSVSIGQGRVLLARALLETGEAEAAVASFRAALSYTVERRPRVIAKLGLARSLAALGRAEEAAAAFLQAAESEPPLEPWVAIRAAESLASQGDTAAVVSLLPRTEAVPPERRASAEATARLEANDQTGAVRALLTAAEAIRSEERSTNLRLHAARLVLEDEDTAAAGALLRKIVDAAPASALEAAKLLSKLPDLDAADHRRLARAYERSGAPGPAAWQYERYLELASLSRLERQRLRLKIGELLFRAGYYFAAITQLERLLDSDPSSVTKAQAEYLIARSTYRRGWRRDGRQRLRAVADRYPGSGSALRALSLLADIYGAAGNSAEARKVHDELLDRYADSSPARRARSKLGMSAFLEGDYEDARNHFDRLRRTEPNRDSRVRAAYWAARARLAADDPSQAGEAQELLRWVHDRDPFGYYGFLAAERAGIDPWDRLPEGPTPAPLDADLGRRLAAMDVLREAGLVDDARSILSTVMASPPKAPEELLELSKELARRGFGLEAVRLGWRAHSRLRGRWSASVLRAIYPLAYREIILAESHARGADPHTIAAIARRESAFAPEVVSRAGARGLLQLMPTTAKWLAGRLELSQYEDELLFHPEYNVHLGVAYFADLQRRYGELQIALVAYNAGPTRARNWRQRPEYSAGPELFAERIPFSETRKYVRAVQTQLRIYRHLYPDFR